MEFNARNLPSSTWTDDYSSPLKPTPAPPDTTQASGYVRHSSLPLDAIAEAVNSSGAGINAWIDWDVDPGHFLCEYMAYHDAWYQSLHSDPCDQYYCFAAGFTHLAAGVTPSNGTAGVEAALRALISQLDLQLIQYTVSGTVTVSGSPLAGVTMTGLPGNPLTNASGVYTAQVGGGWSGVVTPLKSGYAFTQKTYSNVRANQSAQDYTTSAAAVDTIAFDAASNNYGSTAATTLSWSHTVGSGNNRILVVGVVAEDSTAADQIISSVKFNSVNMTAVSGSTKSRVVYSGTSYSTTLRTDLYYMLNPPVGTYTVLVTYNGSVTYRVGGAVSLINVKQQAPEAVAANAATAAAISTSLTIPNDGAWIVDVVGHSNSGSFTSSSTTERWDRNSGNHTGACGTKAVTTPGLNTITWTFSSSSATIAHSLAAFAPSETATSSPPGKATSPSPANGAIGIGVTTDLSWSAGPNAVSHDVYFGTASSPPLVSSSQAGTTYDTGTMAGGTTYYWRIDEKNAGGTTTGDVWSFTTVIAAPGAASNPNPASGATNVSLTQDLTWSAGSGATSHDVYFGTTSPGTFRGNQAGTTFDTGTMAGGTTYYWRIDEKNAGGTTTGTVWSFATIVRRTLTASNSGNGHVTTPGEGAFQYDNGINTNIVAAADAHYHFASWTGSAVTAGKVNNPNSANTTVTMDGDYTVVANFSINQQSLTTSALPGGTVTTPGIGTYWYNYGNNTNIAASADPDYHFANWTGTGVTAGKVANPNSASTTITTDANYTLQANFAINQFTISASAGPEGNISPAGDVTKDYGSSQMFTATPDTGYTVDTWSVDGIDVQAGGTTYNLNNITTAHTVSVTFLVQTFYITGLAGANGSISPCWTFGRNYGSSQWFIATPDTGYTVDKWTVDDNDVQTGGSFYLLSDITTAHTVMVTFTQAQYSLTVNTVGSGTVTTNPSQTTYHYGEIVQLAADADVGWSFSAWSGDITVGQSPTDITIDDNKIVTATFVKLTYTITASAGANGSIEPGGDVTVNYNDSQLFTATADPGYEVNEWFLDGTGVQTAGTEYTLGNITAVHTVSVTFKPIILSISGFVVELDGNTPVKDVLLSAGDTNVLTDANGYYELAVDYGWSGIVTPQKERYVFEPNSDTYTDVNYNYSDMNYTAAFTTFRITGYVFGPDHITPISDVNVSAENGGGPWTNKYGGGSWSTDGSGYYEVWVDYNWSGKVTPARYAYAFEPNSIGYTDVNSDWTNPEYIATLLTYKISGCIRNECNLPIAGVMVSADNGGGQNITDTNGLYEVWVGYAWSGTVTPEKLYYTFNPAGLSYIGELADQADQNYAANNIYDLDCDSSIGWGDVLTMSNNWLYDMSSFPDIKSDINKDNAVDFLDFAEFGLVW
jgi:hypothetical protein